MNLRSKGRYFGKTTCGKNKEQRPLSCCLGKSLLPSFPPPISQRRGGWGRSSFPWKQIVKTFLQAWNLFPSKLLSTLSNQSLLERQMASTWKMSGIISTTTHPRAPPPHSERFWKMLHPASGAFQSGGWGEQTVLQGRGQGAQNLIWRRSLTVSVRQMKEKTIDKEAGVGRQSRRNVGFYGACKPELKY